MILRHQYDNHFMVSPMKSQDDGESQHNENKKSKNRHLVIINQLRKKVNNLPISSNLTPTGRSLG